VRQDRLGRHTRLPFQRFGGRLPAHINRQRRQRDQKQHFEADLLHVIVFPDKGEQQEAQAENRPDRREVIDQQMNVGEVRLIG
jgi:hypothetical protein